MNLGLILAIISHAGLLLHTEQDVESIAKNIFFAHSEKFPSKVEGLKLLDDCLNVLGSGVFAGIPADILSKINEVLNELVKVVNTL